MLHIIKHLSPVTRQVLAAGLRITILLLMCALVLAAAVAGGYESRHIWQNTQYMAGTAWATLAITLLGALAVERASRKQS